MLRARALTLMRLTGLPWEVVSAWPEVEADLWARAGAESLRQVRELVPDQTASLLAGLYAAPGGGDTNR